MTDPKRAIGLLMDVNALENVPRAGYVMSGVELPEDVAAHTAGVAAAALLAITSLFYNVCCCRAKQIAEK